MIRAMSPNWQQISMDDLRVVLAVANHGSFIVAARRSGVPSSTVSRAVARIEEALRVRLFQRTSRCVSLTDEGAHLVERAKPLMEELGGVIDELADPSTEPAGRLRITAPMVTGADWIGSALLSFAEAYPRVSVELSLSNSVVDLVEEGFDLAFRGGPIEGTDLITRRILSVPYTIAAAPGFVADALLDRNALARADLESLQAILPQPGATWRFRHPVEGTVEIHPRSSFCVNDLRVAVAAAARGLGLLRGPVALVESAGLVQLPLADDIGHAEARDLFAVYPSRRLVPSRVRLAVDWIARAANDPKTDLRSRSL